MKSKPKWRMTKFRQQCRKQVCQSWLRKSVSSFRWGKPEATDCLMIFALCLVSRGPIGKMRRTINENAANKHANVTSQIGNQCTIRHRQCSEEPFVSQQNYCYNKIYLIIGEKTNMLRERCKQACQSRLRKSASLITRNRFFCRCSCVAKHFYCSEYSTKKTERWSCRFTSGPKEKQTSMKSSFSAKTCLSIILFLKERHDTIGSCAYPKIGNDVLIGDSLNDRDQGTPYYTE